MIKKLKINNFKIFETFEMDFSEKQNIIVGDNNSGKSCLIEALIVGLTKKYRGYTVDYNILQDLFK